MAETEKTGADLLGDLTGFKSLEREAHELLDQLQRWRQERFEDWCREIQESIDDPKASLSLAFSLISIKTDVKGHKMFS